MTKEALKRRNARLIEKRDQMNALIDNTEQEIKEIDCRESRELLEKFHIESEELARLILMRNNENREEDTETPLINKRVRRTKVEAGSEADTEPVKPWIEESEEASEPESDECLEEPSYPEEGSTPESQPVYDPLNISRLKEEAE